MKIEDVEYAFLVNRGSEKGGLGLECYRVIGDSKELVLEVFRSDAGQQYTVRQFAPELPLELLEHVTSVARKELGTYVV